MTDQTTVVTPPTAPFGLRLAPFAAQADASFFFPSDQHLRALEFMGHTLWTKARLGVVMAEHGCGKSLLIRRLLQDLDDRIVAAAVQREQMSPRDFLSEISSQYGMALGANDKTDRRRLLEGFMAHQATMGRMCLLIVENPQSMHPSVLEELRSLASMEVEGSRVLKVLLLGQPSLSLVLDSQRMAQLVTANVPRFTLGPLSEDQTAAYVAHRLRAAGAADPDALMPYTLMPHIHSCSSGVPAHINRLCERALEHAAAESAPMVTASALDKATADLGWENRRPAAPAWVDTMGEPAPAVQRAHLVIATQGAPDQELRLSSGRILIGRGEEADVRIDSVFVSRYHALIVHDNGQDLLLDLGSTNGLVVNSRRVLRRALRHRDLIQIGPAKVMYYNEHAAGAQPDPGETICFARPGFPQEPDSDDEATVLAFGRLNSSG